MNTTAKAYASLIFICLVWGTTYLAIKVGVKYYPAFLFAGIRQCVSGIILIAAALALTPAKDVSKANVLRQMLVGFLMLTVGNGCVTWGERAIPSGAAALICSLMPLFAALFNVVLFRRERMNLFIGLGMLLGVIGVGIVFRDNLKDLSNGAYLAGMLAVLLATASWAMGSIVNKGNTKPVNPFFNSGLQLLFGGLFMLLLSPVADDHSQPLQWHNEGLLALAYLTLFGSVLAYAAYMFALAHLPVGIATIYAYINPMVAVALGAIFMNEPMSVYTWLAFGTIVTSVLLVNRGYKVKTVSNKIVSR